MQCTGDEDYLTDCAGSDSCCGHHRDVGLYCQPACTEGQIRFMDGPTEMEGRVEICHLGRWGTVCDDFWQTKDARVACKMAGFPWRGILLSTVLKCHAFTSFFDVMNYYSYLNYNFSFRCPGFPGIIHFRQL